MSFLLSVTSSLLVGTLLVVAPWSVLWDTNWALSALPLLRPLLLSGVARGLVTGLGLANLLVAAFDLGAAWERHRA